jgi:hypothetical protein
MTWGRIARFALALLTFLWFGCQLDRISERFGAKLLSFPPHPDPCATPLEIRGSW